MGPRGGCSENILPCVVERHQTNKGATDSHNQAHQCAPHHALGVDELWKADNNPEKKAHILMSSKDIFHQDG